MSMPLRMPLSTISALAQQAAEPHAALVALDLLRIGRRHRGDAIGELQPGLQKADAAEIFEAVNVERRARGRPIAPVSVAVELALIGHVVDGHHGAGPRPRRHSADRPAPARPASHGHGRRRARSAGTRPWPISAAMRDSAAKRTPLSGQSTPSGGRRRDCPAARRDAARRARTGRGPSCEPASRRPGPPK